MQGKKNSKSNLRVFSFPHKPRNEATSHYPSAMGLSTQRILYIPFDHLHRNYGALKDAHPTTDIVAFVESKRMTTGRPWHKERLFFLISSARHFATSLEDEGFTVEYVKAASTIDGLKQISKKHNNLPITCAEPSSFTQYQQLKSHGLTFFDNDFFLTPRPLFTQWADEQKTYLMENFYRKQLQNLEKAMRIS